VVEKGWSELEERANTAARLDAFPVNLNKIRETVSSLLKEVGKYGFFEEYTDHSFDHVSAMISTASWIIPEQTKKRLSPGDCLFIVLCIYLHDIGLLISRKEFGDRDKNADYQKFRNNPPIPADRYREFIARLDQLPQEQADKVLYQEYVRHSHGVRVRSWIEGVPLDNGGSTKQIMAIIGDLLKDLDHTVRRDLALVCESHTKDDIADSSKYKVSQPYGNSAEETVNLQYVAVILRSVDLLHITKGRAPSVLYQFISPSDPVSQIEWQKQSDVRSVRPKPGLDRQGKASDDATPDTIQVHARFQNSEGFFGLTGYLTYAERELKSCHDAIERSSNQLTSPPLFPWQYIDQAGVEAVGFVAKSLGFTIDQHKILDLLTGRKQSADNNR
jgi:molecular chaperone HtpG